MNTLKCWNLSISPVLTDLALRNSSFGIEHLLTGKDAAWILTSSVIIFTMQTGEASISVKTLDKDPR